MEENIIRIEEALSLPNTIFIDVRSENEFNEANIPGSINIPILNNEERSIVGKVYRENSVEEAKILGLKYASNKLESIYRDVLKLKRKYDNIVLYCWRGGMRSKSVCNVLRTLQVKKVYRLVGGYKSYRRFVMEYIENHINEFKFIVLHGLTGVGKTIIIEELEKKGIQVINLERLAKNSGSVFGDLPFEGESPSQKQFESLLFNNLYYNDSKYVVIESESKRIGSINVPDTILKAMEDGYHILIETNIQNRIQNIFNEYINKGYELDERIIKCIKHLRKRLGNQNVEMLIERINCGDYKFVIEFLINNYYDPLYKYSIEKINKTDLLINYETIDEAVKNIKDFINRNITEGSQNSNE